MLYCPKKDKGAGAFLGLLANNRKAGVSMNGWIGEILQVNLMLWGEKGSAPKEYAETAIRF